MKFKITNRKTGQTWESDGNKYSTRLFIIEEIAPAPDPKEAKKATTQQTKNEELPASEQG